MAWEWDINNHSFFTTCGGQINQFLDAQEFDLLPLGGMAAISATTIQSVSPIVYRIQSITTNSL